MSERVLEPLEMSDTEIVDWMNEYCGTVKFCRGSDYMPMRFLVDSYHGTTYGMSVRDAVKKAAAHQNEANRDF